MPLAAPLTLILVVAGCEAGGNKTPTLQQISPASAYSDVPVAVTLIGGPFHPPVRVDTYAGSADLAPSPFQVSLDPLRPVVGRRSVAAIEATWIDKDEIDAALPAGLLAGSYMVSLRDAAGNAISSSAMFTSLGPDLDPPHVVFLEPADGVTFAPHEMVDVAVQVDDGPGQVGSVMWSRSEAASMPMDLPGATSCTLDPMGTCHFQITADPGPDLVDQIDIRVDALDAVNNHATAFRRVQVASRPSVTAVFPTEASTVGGTTIRVYGDGLVPNLSQITVDGLTIGGLVDSQGASISATTTAHVPGDALIGVSNGHGMSMSLPFTFIAPPILKLVDPPEAAAAASTLTIAVSGNNFRSDTEFTWIQNDGTPQAIPYAPPENTAPQPPYERLLSSTRVSLVLVPAGGAKAFTPGPIDIKAHDPVSYDFTLANAFTFVDAAP